MKRVIRTNPACFAALGGPESAADPWEVVAPTRHFDVASSHRTRSVDPVRRSLATAARAPA
jgi:hypothetical protein